MTDYQDNNEKSVRNHLSEFYQDYYHARRSKRNIHRRQDEDDDSSDSDGNDNYNKRSPTEFDWRTKNVVSSIKDQGQCGSCYAFATSAVMESAHAIKTRSGNVIDFSPQEIVDCSSNGNYGCDGGDFGPTVNYLSGQKGEIATLASYPYVATQETCQTSNIKRIDLGHIKYGQVTQGDETKLAEAVVNNGPLYIALYANTQDFMFYESGVLSISNCPNSVQDLDHALALVGYGYDNELQKAYWIIKNSWGTSWGEDGYLRLARDAGNMCGVSSWAFYANLN
jgi:C1A family cysteine protease